MALNSRNSRTISRVWHDRLLSAYLLLSASVLSLPPIDFLTFIFSPAPSFCILNLSVVLLSILMATAREEKLSFYLLRICGWAWELNWHKTNLQWEKHGSFIKFSYAYRSLHERMKNWRHAQSRKLLHFLDKETICEELIRQRGLG